MLLYMRYLLEVGHRVCVTQPRVSAALALAARVAHERGCLPGQDVGYAVSMGTCRSPRTGIVVRKENRERKGTSANAMEDHVALRESHITLCVGFSLTKSSTSKLSVGFSFKGARRSRPWTTAAAASAGRCGRTSAYDVFVSQFVTEGVLLREMFASPLLTHYSCIVLDEVSARPAPRAPGPSRWSQGLLPPVVRPQFKYF
ncbi:ATP-dependent RNA helicase dhx8 [Eumeta japonica]|uniref:ATP-dependent RNA helicase dhx8 n=1 Tax=Eumeta variegata TaxID=151549 RepID=A0A4C1Z6H3_EUMVA|nr:ATP-dependent RNA helicase dhx8 [Eumeta japonica]